MKEETRQFLAHARDMLARGYRMLAVDLVEDAGRAAYLAAFHSAQALIFERESRVLKTHGGVHSEFAKLTRDEPGFADDLRGFVSRAFVFKTLADYDPQPRKPATKADASEAMAAATRFTDAVEALIEAPGHLPE